MRSPTNETVYGGAASQPAQQRSNINVMVRDSLDHGVQCRGCNEWIMGRRYQCANCPSDPVPYSLVSGVSSAALVLPLTPVRTATVLALRTAILQDPRPDARVCQVRPAGALSPAVTGAHAADSCGCITKSAAAIADPRTRSSSTRPRWARYAPRLPSTHETRRPTSDASHIAR